MFCMKTADKWLKSDQSFYILYIRNIISNISGWLTAIDFHLRYDKMLWTRLSLQKYIKISDELSIYNYHPILTSEALSIVSQNIFSWILYAYIAVNTLN